MANNYLTFSFAVPYKTDEEHAWFDQLEKLVGGLHNLYGYVGDYEGDQMTLADVQAALARHEAAFAAEGGRGVEVAEALDTLHLAVEFWDSLDQLDDLEYANFQIDVEEERGWAWFYAEEGGDPANAAVFLEAFLAKFRPDETLGFTWAATCSKLRLDEFDGGGVFITADGAQYVYGGGWVWDQKQRRQIEAVTTDEARADWRYEVANGDTVLGLTDWLIHRAEAAKTNAA